MLCDKDLLGTLERGQDHIHSGTLTHHLNSKRAFESALSHSWAYGWPCSNHSILKNRLKILKALIVSALH